MIPDLVNIEGAPWALLPPGIHRASLLEIEGTFAFNPPRRKLFEGLVAALKALAHAGCRKIYLDGSYVTAKPIPGDYDACWDHVGIDPSLLDPVFLDFSKGRANQKAKYLGEFFPAVSSAAPGRIFMHFFQTDRSTGNAKGILEIDLTSESFEALGGRT